MSKALYKYVAVIGIDGMGSFNGKTATPELDRIFENGAVSFDGISLDPTISAQNWGAMLLGVKPTVHKLTNGIVGRTEYTNELLPSIFKRIRADYPNAYLASFCNWNPINYGIIEHSLGADLQTADNDAQLLEKILPAVAKKPTFLFVQFDDVDGAGHHFGYGTQGHLDKITEIDGYVGKIYDAYKEAGILEDTLFVVTADHGGYSHSHGGYNDTEKYVFVGAVGKDVEKGTVGGFQTRDIASIVLYALGVDMPEYDEGGFSSRIPDGIFSGVACKARPVSAPHYVPTRPTPAIDAADGLYGFVDKDKVKLALFFDNDLKDSTGKCDVKEYGLVKYYSNGITGSYGEFGITGSIGLKDIDLDTMDAYTASVWLKIDRTLTGKLFVFGQKNYGEGQSASGVSCAVRCNDIVFVIGDDDDDVEVILPFPDEISEGWVNVTIAVDKKNGTMSFYNNFKLDTVFELPEEFRKPVCKCLEFRFGDDSTGTFNAVKCHTTFLADDFILFDGALSEEEIRRFGGYYGK